MALRWYCDSCKDYYDSCSRTGCCEKSMCFGNPLIAVGAGGAPSQSIEGLCILVCDASYSMDHPAFPDSSLATKLRLICGAIQRAVIGLTEISRKEDAFIAIIGFASRADLITDKAGKPFIKSIQSIEDQFEGGTTLGQYIFDHLSTDRSNLGRDYTDLTAGLSLAWTIYDQTLRRDLTQFGINNPIGHLEQRDILVNRKQKTVPNIRILAYSDGCHNPQNGNTLTTPFAKTEISPLMTAFIGDPLHDESTKIGVQQLTDLANICPEHKIKGYFQIDAPDKHAQLRDLFKMASGASGFCPSCIKSARLSSSSQ